MCIALVLIDMYMLYNYLATLIIAIKQVSISAQEGGLTFKEYGMCVMMHTVQLF